MTKKSTAILAVVLIAAAALTAAFCYFKNASPATDLSEAGKTKAALDATTNPVNGLVVGQAMPETNPFKVKVNPFDSYKNPFKK